MDEDKISSDASDKRKFEEDSVSPKPNVKRVKLVRPVFSPVTKPIISTVNETNKSDLHLTEVPKSNNSSDHSPNVVSVPSQDKLFLHSESIRHFNDLSGTANNTIEPPETVEKLIELPHTVNELIKLPETVKSLVESLENVESFVEPPEIVKSPVEPSVSVEETFDPIETISTPEEAHISTNVVSEEQADSSSDVLDIPNIFSEETKKELENLKKNIFKIEDDGSSSENDSQPKRPRLKRPTFVTSVNENKFESNNSSVLGKTHETSNLDSIKLVSEENINVIGSTKETGIKTQIIVENMKEAEKIAKTINTVEEENIDIANVNVIKKETVENKNVESLIENESTINKVEEKPTEFSSIHKLVEKTTSVIKSSEVSIEGNVPEFTQKTLNSDNDNIKLMLNNMETDFDDQETIVEKVEEDILNKKKLTDTEENNQTTDDQTKSTEMPTEKIGNLNENLNYNRFDNYRVVIERYVDCKSTNKTKHDETNRIIAEISETNKAELIEGCNKNEDKATVVADVECVVTNKMESSQINQTHVTIKVDENPNLENEKQKSNIITPVENKTDSCFDMSSKLKLDEHESQKCNSDILKAALTSKKSLELLKNIPDDQHNTTPLETKETEILPTIGEEAIVNKIEEEIKLPSKELPTNVLTLQNTVHSNMPETKISKDTSSSNYCYENIQIDKNDEPPKWGSAKMNEVEKFLNDSNVTITPISKSQETPKLGKITLKLPKIGNPEIKSETKSQPNVKSELLKKIVNNRISMSDSPLKSALSQPCESFKDFAAIRPISKPSAEQIALLEQQILSTPKKRGRPPKALAQQKQLLLQYQQLQHKLQEGNVEACDESVFHAPLFDMEDMSGRTEEYNSFNTSTPKRAKNDLKRSKNSRGRRGRGGSSRGRYESDSDTAPKIKYLNDDADNYQRELNEDEETKQVALIEAERLRKEEIRERKLEERKKKLKERSDLLKEKKLKKKQRAEERRLQWHEKKRLMQEEKARAAEMKKSLPPPQNFDDETRMSADYNSLSQTPARNFMMIDDDLSISGATNDSIRMKKGRMEVIDLESNKTLTVDQIAEYQWPLEGGELYMIQEQISNFLGVKSFKRKYPSLKRRNVEAEERTFLCDSGLVAESLCDLGLTVLYSSEVLDVMYADFPEKYEELREYMRLKHAKELSNRQRALMTISSNTDGSKLDLRDRALEAAANWNANFNKSRLESRKCSMDMQTFIVHYPKNKCKKMTIPRSKMGNYPLALLPGQFCDYYATYSSEDLRYLPLNTVMYGPLKSVDKDFPVSLSSQSESEDSSSDDSSDSDDSIDMDNKLGTNGLECSPSDKKGAECKICLGTAERNKKEIAEPLIHCSKCLAIYHPTCLEITLEMVPHIKRYNWQCNECKSCAQCKELADDDKMLFCDLCDRGYHIYCVGLRKVPEGRWHCQKCAMCSSCGVSDPGPGDSKWFYEFKKIEKTGSKVYCRTLCAPCSRSWKKGHYCPNCMRCYTTKNMERMTQCNSCDRYLHPECIGENTPDRQVVTCTICEEKAVSRLLTTVPRSLIKV